MAIITLTTDFGATDNFAGVMKGVILGIAPDAAIIDLCHEIPPQDILAGALALESAVDYFPPGTIHLAVVDPGVGSERAAIAVETDRFILVGPDNGVFTLAVDKCGQFQAVELTNPEFHLSPLSATFHGRDIFAPVAAHIAKGARLFELGEPVEQLCRIALPVPKTHGFVLEAQVLRSDRFGNLITNLTQARYDAWMAGRVQSARVQIGETTVGEIRRTYADVEPGAPVAYFGSGGRLEIGVRNGSAAQVMSDSDPVTISVTA